MRTLIVTDRHDGTEFVFHEGTREFDQEVETAARINNLHPDAAMNLLEQGQELCSNAFVRRLMRKESA